MPEVEFDRFFRDEKKKNLVIYDCIEDRLLQFEHINNNLLHYYSLPVINYFDFAKQRNFKRLHFFYSMYYNA